MPAPAQPAVDEKQAGVDVGRGSEDIRTSRRPQGTPPVPQHDDALPQVWHGDRPCVARSLNRSQGRASPSEIIAETGASHVPVETSVTGIIFLSYF